MCDELCASVKLNQTHLIVKLSNVESVGLWAVLEEDLCLSRLSRGFFHFLFKIFGSFSKCLSQEFSSVFSARRSYEFSVFMSY